MSLDSGIAFEGRASGKVILFGEHAVVYAVPGIAAGLDRGARATARKAAPGEGSSLLLSEKRHACAAASDDDLARALHAVLSLDPPIEDLRIEAHAEVPPGGGLGCSAALGVAIARAAEKARAGSAELDAAVEERVFERGLAWERIFHGNPSGIDTAAAARGTFLLFERGVGTHVLETAVDVWLAVGYSGSSASTKEMVEGIARIKERKPDLFEKFLGGVGSIVKNATLALDAGDGRALGQLMDMNQMLLAGVMLSTDAIESMCRIARASGALGAKLTGSGGGGSVIALGGVCPRAETSSEAEAVALRVTEAWNAAGFKSFASCIRGGSARRPEPRGTP